MLVSPAYAQAAYAQTAPAPGGSGFDIISFLPLVLIFVVFYFLILRPQQKKQKEHRAMIEAVKRGDRVVTSGGIIGSVAKVEDRELVLEIADNVRVKTLKGMIADVIARPGSAGADKDEKKEKKSGDAEYYRALGVKENASAAEIAAAFAQKQGDAAAVEAYEVLKDPKLRKLYDRLGHDEFVSSTR